MSEEQVTGLGPAGEKEWSGTTEACGLGKGGGGHQCVSSSVTLNGIMLIMANICWTLIRC